MDNVPDNVPLFRAFSSASSVLQAVQNQAIDLGFVRSIEIRYLGQPAVSQEESVSLQTLLHEHFPEISNVCTVILGAVPENVARCVVRLLNCDNVRHYEVHLRSEHDEFSANLPDVNTFYSF